MYPVLQGSCSEELGAGGPGGEVPWESNEVWWAAGPPIACSDKENIAVVKTLPNVLQQSSDALD